MRPASNRPVLALLLVLCAGSALAQQPMPIPSQPGQPMPPAGQPPRRPGQPKPYKDVITAEAKSDPGMFLVHRIGDRIYYEIPENRFNRVMLWTTEIAQVPTGFGYGGTAVGDRVVRWTRRENKVYLRDVSFRLRGVGSEALEAGVAAATLEPIVMAFDIEAIGENNSAVIEVTRLLTTDVSEFSARGALGAAGLDASRSYIDRVKAFPANIEARSLMTFLPGPTQLPFRGRRGGDSRSLTVLIHYSLSMLPENLMQPRLFDDRVGYFTRSFEEVGTENRVAQREYINRYRLEKKDPNAALSEPVKPIVYYTSREMPEWLRPHMKQGVEDWNVAFEAAGFKNAIQCKEAPTFAEDPNWDPEDARYSVIRWAPIAVQNAMGPHVHDPRTGEIISAHVVFWHDILKLLEAWYFVQVSPLDPSAQKLPLSRELMGELVRYVCAHEVGHTLGLRHNHKASSSFSVAQLRNKDFTEKWGNQASIMDYGRFNYVAQPGDGARLIPKIAQYDLFAIEWGYRPFPGKNTEQEKPDLDRLAQKQITDLTLRFGGEDESSLVDPTVQSEDLGSDPIEATTYGLENINRVAKLLIPATSRPGEDYTLLQEMYDQLMGQRSRELSHVLKLVGGVIETRYHSGSAPDVNFQPVSREKQAQAVRFLVANGLTTPRQLLLPEILNRIEPSGASQRVLNSQRNILTSLLLDDRIKRIEDQQLQKKSGAYTVTELVVSLQHGVWNELANKEPVVDLYRQNLQRAYLTLMRSRLLGDAATQTSLRPIGVSSLRDLAWGIDKALPRVKEPVTKAHLVECRKDIERIVNPKT